VATAAEMFLSKSMREMNEIAHQKMQGHLRAVISTLPFEEIHANPEAFAQSVQRLTADDLANMGIQVVSFTIREIRDPSGYLKALGRPQLGRHRSARAVARAPAPAPKPHRRSRRRPRVQPSTAPLARRLIPASVFRYRPRRPPPDRIRSRRRAPGSAHGSRRRRGPRSAGGRVLSGKSRCARDRCRSSTVRPPWRA